MSTGAIQFLDQERPTDSVRGFGGFSFLQTSNWRYAGVVATPCPSILFNIIYSERKLIHYRSHLCTSRQTREKSMLPLLWSNLLPPLDDFIKELQRIGFPVCQLVNCHFVSVVNCAQEGRYLASSVNRIFIFLVSSILQS